MQGLSKFLEKPFEWMALRYQASVGTELRKYGLRYEDLYDPTLDLVGTLCPLSILATQPIKLSRQISS